MTHEAGLRAVHVDEHLIALDKPAGLLCVPGRGADKADCLIARAQRRWPDAAVVHRLDMATSGLVLLARGADMQRALSAAFAQRQIGKRYEAIVHGLPTAADVAATHMGTPCPGCGLPHATSGGADWDAPCGAGWDEPWDAAATAATAAAARCGAWRHICLPIAPDWPRRPRSHVCHTHGKPSHTRWRLLAHRAGGADAGSAHGAHNTDGANGADGLSRLALHPVTGRTHQLRVHLAAIGHPIVGDALYGPNAAAHPPPARMLLHACQLRLRHPASGQWLHLRSPAPFGLGG